MHRVKDWANHDPETVVVSRYDGAWHCDIALCTYMLLSGGPVSYLGKELTSPISIVTIKPVQCPGLGTGQSANTSRFWPHPPTLLPGRYVHYHWHDIPPSGLSSSNMPAPSASHNRLSFSLCESLIKKKQKMLKNIINYFGNTTWISNSILV